MHAISHSYLPSPCCNRSIQAARHTVANRQSVSFPASSNSRVAQRHTLAAAVFQPPEGAALVGPAATAPACALFAGGVTGLTGSVAAAGVRVGVAAAGVMVGVAVVAAVVAVEPMGALGVAGAAVAAGVAAAAAGEGAASST